MSLGRPDLLRESKKELKATESALTILQARATTMKDLQKQLVESQSSLETMASQIRALSNFWIAVRANYLCFQGNRMLMLPLLQD